MITDWVEITIIVTPETEEAVANILCELGSNGVVMTDPEQGTGRAVSGYIPAGERIQDRLRAIRTLWDELCHLGFATGACQITVRPLPASDWTTGWQDRFSPVHVSDRLVVAPPWASVPARDDRIVIEIVPGMAFGTGEHETTRLCLCALEQFVRAGDRVLDIGTGSGILAIAAAGLNAQEVVAVDVDDVAVDDAWKNIGRNSLDDRISVFCGSVDHPSVTGVFRIIVSNTDIQTLTALLPSFHRLLKADGALILSGVLKEERDTLVRSLKAQTYTVTHDTTLGEWWAGVAIQRLI